MINSVLIHTLSTFSKDEMKKFGDFVISPYFNKKTAVITLFRYIKKHYLDEDREKLKRESAWMSIFPEKKYNYGVMKNLIHELTKLSEYYLQLQSFDADVYRKQFLLLENLNQRSDKKLFSSKFKLLEEKLKDRKIFSPEIYEYLKDLSIMEYDFNFKNTSVLKDKDITYKISEYEIYYTLIECFKNFNNIVSFKMRNNYTKKINILESFLDGIPFQSILNKIKELSEYDFIIMNTYYLMYLATKHDQETEHYFRFKAYLVSHDKYFDNHEVRLLYNFLESTLTINDNIADRNAEYFEIDKIRVKRNLILDEKKEISFNEYAGIIKTAADFGETEFLKNFISSHLKNVPKPLRKNAENFSNAHLNYITGDFDKAIENIACVDANSSEYKLNLRSLNLKILYEKNDFVSFEYLLDSFRHYLNKDVVQDNYRIIYLNYCTFLNRLFKVRDAKNISEYNLLKKEITAGNTANKLWLLKKIDELMKKKK